MMLPGCCPEYFEKDKAQLTAAVSTNEETKAHRASLVFLITNALEVK